MCIKNKSQHLSGFIIAHDEVGVGVRVGDETLGQSSTAAAGEGAADAGDPRAGRHAAGGGPIRRLTAGAAHHRTAAQVVLALSDSTVSGLQGETKSYL